MIRRVFRNLYFLTFLNGFLLASLFYFYVEARYEKELFQAIHSDINTKIKDADTQDSVIVKAMHTCHELMSNRVTVFEGKQFGGIKSNLLETASMDLMTARGACGSFSMVLARVLQDYKYRIRIAQMKVDGIYAQHNIVEAETAHGWAVLDPFYDVYFVNRSNKLASFDEVKNNWTYYKNQLPPGYNMEYRYEDVRYSNWTKIPVILPGIKKILDLTLGKQEADAISIRSFFLSKYDFCFNVVLILFLFVFAYTVIKIIKAKIFPQQNIPVTFSNVYKYLRLRFYHKELADVRHKA